MENNEKIIVNEISKKYNKNKNYIKLLVKICEDFKVENIKEEIEKIIIRCVKRCVNNSMKITKQYDIT